ncbi:MAG: type II toxin-antitoxin system PemK/MazF family toxin [Deltaproteobacteria bacterium]|nr:type II toxin-antitoxin system PemK/MazF family toxin [Deltaproteobacteria bacterium]
MARAKIDAEFGDVLLVPFPFTDQTAVKQRPAVVVSSNAYHRDRPDLIILAVTSQTRPGDGKIGEAAIDHWEEAGLLKPSVLKPLLATLERGLVRRKLGHLGQDDRHTLRRLLDEILGE